MERSFAASAESLRAGAARSTYTDTQFVCAGLLAAARAQPEGVRETRHGARQLLKGQ